MSPSTLQLPAAASQRPAAKPKQRAPWSRQPATSPEEPKDAKPWQDLAAPTQQPATIPKQPAAPPPPLANPAKLQIKIWTLGLLDAQAFTKDANLWHEAINCANSQKRQVPRDLVTNLLLSAQGTKVVRTDVFVEVDTRDFNDRSAAAGGHLGSYYANLVNFVEKGPKVFSTRTYRKEPWTFKDWFKSFPLASLWDAIQKNRAELLDPDEFVVLHIISYCRSGKHRSVGIATLLQHALEQWPSVEVSYLYAQNLSRASWNGGRMCNACEDCMSVSDPRADSARNAAVEALFLSLQSGTLDQGRGTRE